MQGGKGVSREVVSIRTPSVLEFAGSQGEVFYGADQEWFNRVWQRIAGCGPTAAASLLWYLACTRPECAGLAPEAPAVSRDASKEASKKAMLAHMETVWQYVKPGIYGVNRTNIFRDGVLRFGADRGIPLAVEVLDVPPGIENRPDRGKTAAFLTEALTKDLPPAFLNLAKGKENRLENWHWVTMTAFCSETMTGWCYDQGAHREFDMALWLETSSQGGGFVTVRNR